MEDGDALRAVGERDLLGFANASTLSGNVAPTVRADVKVFGMGIVEE